MEKKLIYLVYQTDAWHSVETRKLVYIGENLEETIRKMTISILDMEEWQTEWRTFVRLSASLRVGTTTASEALTVLYEITTWNGERLSSGGSSSVKALRKEQCTLSLKMKRCG